MVEIVRGSSVKIESTVYVDEGVTPANLTLAYITFIVKKRSLDSDASALYTKVIGSGLSVVSETAGTINVFLTPTDTNYSDSFLFWELIVTLSDGTVIRNGVNKFRLVGNVKIAL